MSTLTTPTAATPTVYIVDDDPTLCDSLQSLLSSVGLQTRAFTQIDKFLSVYRPDQPACLLLNMQVGGHTNTRLQQQLREQNIHVPVIIITNRGDVATAVAAMKQGALDFIEKPLNDQLLLDCIHSALAEDTVRRRTQARQRELTRRFNTLTPREQDVLHRVVAGLSNREIASLLDLSRKTVEVHRAKVMQKMRADTLSRLIRMTMAIGILKIYDEED